MRPTPNAITITDAAAERVKSLLVKRDQPPAGLRISVKAKGCSGLSYVIDYADEKGPHDEVVQDKGVTIFIDPARHHVHHRHRSGLCRRQAAVRLRLQNPNEKGRCGCGESFHV